MLGLAKERVVTVLDVPSGLGTSVFVMLTFQEMPNPAEEFCSS